MICPHCKKDGIKFSKVYWWPYGRKTCSKCSDISKVKKRPLLTFISFFLGLGACLPPMLLGKIWYFIPYIVVALIVDYSMDKKFRELVSANP